MPYITQETRKIIDPYLKSVFDMFENFKGCGVGDLNYIITKIIHEWLKRKGLKYENLNATIGVLDCAKMELYRCVVALYENKKKEENGFISNLDRITKDEKQAIWKCKKCNQIFNDNEVHEVCGHETYYQCPNIDCKADSANWELIRDSIE